jgi:GTPase SAR1 family protein
MVGGPNWLPNIDINEVPEILNDGLQQLPEDIVSNAPGVLAGVEPTTLIIGTVVSALVEESVTEYGRKLNLQLEEYAAEHRDNREILAKAAKGVSCLLPDGEGLNQAAIDAARGDPEELRKKLQEYSENAQLQEDLNDAVQRVLTGNFEDLEYELNEAFDTKDTEAAQALLFDFMEVIRTRQVQQVFEKVLKFDSRFDDLEDELMEARQRLNSNLRELIQADLRDEGFRRLSPLTFDRKISTPESAWRAGFKFAHVRRGYATDRYYSDGTNVTDILFEKLTTESESSVIVEGNSGSGKSTICKQVACHWYNQPNTGPVFYRESGSGGRGFTSVGKLESTIRNSNRHVLVVVEDATRTETESIYDVIQQFKNEAAGVSFLLDGRTNELQAFDTPTRMETGIEERLREAFKSIERVKTPPLTLDEVRDAIETFESLTDRTVSNSAEYVYDELQTGAEIGDVLYLTYYFPVNEDDDATGLESDVVDKYRTLKSPGQVKSQRQDLALYDERLLQDVGLMINLLNATRIGVYPELIHTLGYHHGDNNETHNEIEDIRSSLEGWFIYRASEEDDQILRTTHELWSTLYLRELAYEEQTRQEDSRRVTKSNTRFARCVDALFALFRDGNHRETLLDQFPDSNLLHRLETNTKEMSDEYVEDLFDLGKRWPVLTPLFGTTNRSQYELPGSCSAATGVRAAVMLGLMHQKRGNHETAKEELETAEQWHQRNDINDQETELLLNRCLGWNGLMRTDIETAEECFQRCLKNSKQLSNITRAVDHMNLFYYSLHANDFENAEAHLRAYLECLESADPDNLLFDPEQHKTLISLQEQMLENGGTPETGRKVFEIVLESAERAGQEPMIIRALAWRGVLESRVHEWNTAHRYLTSALRKSSSIGERKLEMMLLRNLVLICIRQDNIEEARRRYDRMNTIRNNEDVELLPRDEFLLEAIEAWIPWKKIGERVVLLHQNANKAVLRGSLIDAIELYGEGWRLHKEIDEDAVVNGHNIYPLVLSMGLALAALIRFIQNNGINIAIESDIIIESVNERSVDDILEGIHKEQERLTSAAKVLFDYLSGQDVLTSRHELSSGTDPELYEVEREALIKQIRLLRAIENDRDIEDAKLLPSAEVVLEILEKRTSWSDLGERITLLHRNANRQVLDDSPTDAIRLYEEGWELRKKVDEHTKVDKHNIQPLVLSMGLGLAAHIQIIRSNEIGPVPKDDILVNNPDNRSVDNILNSIRKEREDLTPAAKALFAHLTERDVFNSYYEFIDAMSSNSGSELSQLEQKSFFLQIDRLQHTGPDLRRISSVLTEEGMDEAMRVVLEQIEQQGTVEWSDIRNDLTSGQWGRLIQTGILVDAGDGFVVSREAL